MDNILELKEAYLNRKFEYEQFLASVLTFFQKNPKLNNSTPPIIHSLKSRMKDPSHLEDKINRKEKEGIHITKDNLFHEITDLAGVRVLHIYQDQFLPIHRSIKENVEQGNWAFVEPPEAYSWDPESQKIYEDLNIIPKIKPTYYTSVHYVVKPNNQNKNPICCEIQVRTLFEETWGEISHYINYPYPTKNKSCNEQLRVLAKLVSTGTRLADSILHTYEDFTYSVESIEKNE